MDELFTHFGEDVKHLVRHIAKMAVVSSQEEQLSTGDTLNSVTRHQYGFSVVVAQTGFTLSS